MKWNDPPVMLLGLTLFSVAGFALGHVLLRKRGRG